MANQALAVGLASGLNTYNRIRGEQERQEFVDQWTDWRQQNPWDQRGLGVYEAPTATAPTPSAAPQVPGGAASASPAAPPAANDYLALADQHARRVGVDPALVRGLVRQESNWNPNARSSADAFGLTQVMPATWDAPGFGITPGGDRNDPNEQMRVGTDYLRAMLDRYEGDVPRALAAYNAGPGAVDRAGGIPNIAETQDYVRRVMQFAGQPSSAAPTAGGVGLQPPLPTAAPAAATSDLSPMRENPSDGMMAHLAQGEQLYNSMIADAYVKGQLDDPNTREFLSQASNQLAGQMLTSYNGPDPSTPEGGVMYAEFVGAVTAAVGRDPMEMINQMGVLGVNRTNARTSQNNSATSAYSAQTDRQQAATQQYNAQTSRQNANTSSRETDLREQVYDDGESGRRRQMELELNLAVATGQQARAADLAAQLGYALVDPGTATQTQDMTGRQSYAVDYAYKDTEGNEVQANTSQRIMELTFEMRTLGEMDAARPASPEMWSEDVYGPDPTGSPAPMKLGEKRYYLDTGPDGQMVKREIPLAGSQTQSQTEGALVRVNGGYKVQTADGLTDPEPGGIYDVNGRVVQYDPSDPQRPFVVLE